MYKTKRICRLCLKVSEDDFEVIDEKANEILDELSLKIDLSISVNPVMCKNCVLTLQKSFDLLSKCQNTRDMLCPLGIYDGVCERKNVNISSNTNYKTCRFCTQAVKEDFYVPLNQLEEELLALRTFLPKCIFQLYVTATEEPVLCEFCNKTMLKHISYLKSLLEVERKIKNYLAQELDSKSQIDLNSILQCTLVGNITEGEDLDAVKEEHKLNLNELGINTEVDIKKEEFKDTDLCLNMEDQVIDLTLDDNVSFSMSAEVRDAIEKPEANLPSDAHLFYKCHTCPYDTTNKKNLRRHVFTHKEPEVYKCASCPYETKNKVYFRKHSVVHKDISEVQMYKCDVCPFQTRHSWYLNTHVLLHKDASETTIHKCESCPYQTKFEKNFKRHMLNHGDAPQFKCDKCPYSTKHKGCLKRHAIIHKSPSEVTMYKCEFCMYATRHKKNFTLHEVLHKDASEVTMYQCESCPYKTRTKQSLRHHALVHMSDADVKMYKCSLCNYQTRRETNLKQHMMVHKNPSEVEMFKCDLCSYETKRKTNLKQHVITHKKPSGVTMYKCESCPYKSRCKGSFKLHLQTHEKASDNGQ